MISASYSVFDQLLCLAPTSFGFQRYLQVQGIYLFPIKQTSSENDMIPAHLLEKNKMDCLNQEAERSPKTILILQETAGKT